MDSCIPPELRRIIADSEGPIPASPAQGYSSFKRADWVKPQQDRIPSSTRTQHRIPAPYATTIRPSSYQ